MLGLGNLGEGAAGESAAGTSKAAIREQAVSVMNLALACWERELGKSKLDLAEESGIWPVYIDKSTPTTRTRFPAIVPFVKSGSSPNCAPRWFGFPTFGEYFHTSWLSSIAL